MDFCKRTFSNIDHLRLQDSLILKIHSCLIKLIRGFIDFLKVNESPSRLAQVYCMAFIYLQLIVEQYQVLVILVVVL